MSLSEPDPSFKAFGKENAASESDARDSFGGTSLGSTLVLPGRSSMGSEYSPAGEEDGSRDTETVQSRTGSSGAHPAGFL